MRFKRMIAAALAVAVVFGTFTAVSDNRAKDLGAVSASAAILTNEGTSGDYKYGFDEDNLYISKYTGSETSLKVADSLKINGKDTPVYGIATGAFANNTNLKSVTITPNIKVIEGGAFEGCTGMQSLSFELEKNMARLNVRQMAFAGCTSLSSVTFPTDPEGSVLDFYLEDFAFIDCPALKKVMLPKYVNLSSFGPVFGYHQTTKEEFPSFYKDSDGKITTNLEKYDDFTIECYRHTSAAQNAVYCELSVDYIDGVYDLDVVKGYVSEADKNNSNYNIVMTDTGFKGDRVNNLEGYADCIREYYHDMEAFASGYPMIGTHKVVDTSTGEPLLEYGTAYPYSYYDPFMDGGVVSLNCFGESMMLNEYVYFMDLIDGDSPIISSEKLDALSSDMTLKTARPRYCDVYGEDKFTNDYAACDVMKNGYAYAAFSEKDGSSAIIDQSGKAVLKMPQSFSRAVSTGVTNGSTLYTVSYYGMGSAVIGAYGKGLIPYTSQYKHEGKTIFDAPCEQEGFDGWYTDAVGDNKHCGYIDLKGNIVIPQQFLAAGAFYDDGLAWVVSPEQVDKYGYSGNNNTQPIYGFIDTKGKTAIPFEYSDAFDFDGGYAAVKKGTKYGMIDTKNNVVIPFEYEDTKGSVGGFMTAEKDGKWGMLDKYGKVVVPFVFEDVSLYYNGKAFAVSDGKVYRFDIASASGSELFGDVNGDGTVDIEDAVMVISHINGVKALTLEEEARADTTFNGDIDIEDAVLIISQVNGVSVIKPPASMSL